MRGFWGAAPSTELAGSDGQRPPGIAVLPTVASKKPPSVGSRIYSFKGALLTGLVGNRLKGLVGSTAAAYTSQRTRGLGPIDICKSCMSRSETCFKHYTEYLKGGERGVRHGTMSRASFKRISREGISRAPFKGTGRGACPFPLGGRRPTPQNS